MKKFFKSINEWKWVIIILILLFIITSFKEFSIFNISEGLIVELIGSLLTLSLIDKIIQNRENKQKVIIQKIAFKSIKLPIKWALYLFWKMRRAAAIKKLDKPPESWREALLSDNAINDIIHLNYISDAGTYPKSTFSNLIRNTFKNDIIPAFEGMIEKYSLYLDDYSIKILESFKNDQIVQTIFIKNMQFPDSLTKENELGLLYGLEENLKVTINSLIDVVEHYNSLFPKNRIDPPNNDLSENTRPLLGSGRINTNNWKVVG